jgi:hypothetical protein
MSQNLIDAIHIILASSADALEVNSESPADDMFVHTLTSYARAKRESLNALRVVASMGNATSLCPVRSSHLRQLRTSRLRRVQNRMPSSFLN